MFITEQRSIHVRIRRVRTCSHIYNDLYVNDAFHVLFKCPMVAKERIALFNTLNDTCGADEWVRTKTLCDLGVVLLSPQSIDVACAYRLVHLVHRLKVSRRPGG
jgi:hypothetical protein